MTEKEKRTILDMRAAGRQYKEISAELGIEVSALKVFVHRQKHKDVRRCEQCRKTLPKDARKTQRFCSDKCRNDWWYCHQGVLQGLWEGFHIIQTGKILFKSMFLRIKAIITNSGAKPLFL